MKERPGSETFDRHVAAALTEALSTAERIMSEVSVEKLPHVAIDSLASFDRLPTVSGLYFLVSNSGEVLYLGKAENVKARWKPRRNVYGEVMHSTSHRMLLRAVEQQCRLHWLELPKHLITLAETAALRRRKPSWNSVGY